MTVHPPSREQALVGHHVEVSRKGKPLKIPALHIGGKAVIVTGRWIKVAAIFDEGWLEGEVEDPTLFINTLKEYSLDGSRADVFTFAQKLPHVMPQYSYPMEWESVAAIRLKSFEEWWDKAISRHARQDVRRSVKRGVIAKVTEFTDDLVRGIMQIYNDSPIRQATPFWHYQKDFDAVKRENATYLARSTFIGAYYNDELIGFTKIVCVGKVAAMMQFVSKISHFDKRPSNALVAKAVEHSAKTGMSYLTYGKYRYGNITSSLTKFKHRVGFEEILVPRFHVPLTLAGQITLRLGLQGRLADYIPEPVLAKFRNLRSLWYGRRL